MKTHESRAASEIYDIRERIYSERHGLSAHDYNSIVHKNAVAVLERYGIEAVFVRPEHVSRSEGIKRRSLETEAAK
jgi:hypothetical protein